ncbi:MAG TPA: hypothetical protein VFU73_13905 [Actinocrinis sp.]|nr:hypothetical protein [Actinocrinis sp.]
MQPAHTRPQRRRRPRRPTTRWRRTVTWTACQGSTDPALQCATIQVPLDYAHPDSRSITLAIDRLPAANPAQRHGIMLTNPGGPGGSGLSTPEQLRAELPAAALAPYDVIGFDPRFVGHSTPISCGQPAEDLGAIWMRWPHPGSFPGDVAAARQRAAACAANAGCTNDAVNSYLATGHLPASDLSCAGTTAPVPDVPGI